MAAGPSNMKSSVVCMSLDYGIHSTSLTVDNGYDNTKSFTCPSHAFWCDDGTVSIEKPDKGCKIPSVKSVIGQNIMLIQRNKPIRPAECLEEIEELTPDASPDNEKPRQKQRCFAEKFKINSSPFPVPIRIIDPENVYAKFTTELFTDTKKYIDSDRTVSRIYCAVTLPDNASMLVKNTTKRLVKQSLKKVFELDISMITVESVTEATAVAAKVLFTERPTSMVGDDGVVVVIKIDQGSVNMTIVQKKNGSDNSDFETIATKRAKCDTRTNTKGPDVCGAVQTFLEAHRDERYHLNDVCNVVLVGAEALAIDVPALNAVVKQVCKNATVMAPRPVPESDKNIEGDRDERVTDGALQMMMNVRDNHGILRTNIGIVVYQKSRKRYTVQPLVQKGSHLPINKTVEIEFSAHGVEKVEDTKRTPFTLVETDDPIADTAEYATVDAIPGTKFVQYVNHINLANNQAIEVATIRMPTNDIVELDVEISLDGKHCKIGLTDTLEFKLKQVTTLKRKRS